MGEAKPFYLHAPARNKKTPADVHLPDDDIYVSVIIALGRTERIHSWWISGSDPSGPVLLYLHGSALNIGANVNATRRFYKLGFSVLMVSYRGYGMSDGEFPSERNLYADAEAAWNYLVLNKKIRPDNIFLNLDMLNGLSRFISR